MSAVPVGVGRGEPKKESKVEVEPELRIVKRNPCDNMFKENQGGRGARAANCNFSPSQQGGINKINKVNTINRANTVNTSEPSASLKQFSSFFCLLK